MSVCEEGGRGSEELKKCPPPSHTVLQFVNGRERKPKWKKKIFFTYRCICLTIWKERYFIHSSYDVLTSQFKETQCNGPIKLKKIQETGTTGWLVQFHLVLKTSTEDVFLSRQDSY